MRLSWMAANSLRSFGADLNWVGRIDYDLTDEESR